MRWSPRYSQHNKVVKEEGIKEGEFNIAKRMIENSNLSDVEISEISGLSLLDVETLRK